MTNETVKNLGIISTLVEKHFSLDGDSIKYFNDKLFHPHIPDDIRKHFDEDFRYRISLDKDNGFLETIDTSWTMYKNLLNFLFTPYTLDLLDVTYSYDFYKDGLIKIGKSTFRIVKGITHIIDTVIDDYKNRGSKLHDAAMKFINLARINVEEEGGIKKLRETLIAYITSQFKEISEKRLPRKNNMELVISYNFADWFLCSTSETWSSCLNLESEYSKCYWTGLPGLVGDPNKSLLYITNGKKKEYDGIVVEKVKMRSWLELTENDEYVPIRYFPNKIFEIEKTFKYVDGMIFGDNNKAWKSKYPLHLLYHEDGNSCYIYQDNHNFYPLDNGKFYSFSDFDGGGISIYKKEDSTVFSGDTKFNFTSGLSGLKKYNESILDYKKEYSCKVCGDAISEGSSYEFDGEYYCSSCYHSNFDTCDNCGEVYRGEELHYMEEETLCNECYASYYAECEICGNVFTQEEMTYTDDGYMCDSCINSFPTCDVCGDVITEQNVIHIKTDDEVIHLCRRCAMKRDDVKKCTICGGYFHTDDIIINEQENAICKHCLDTVINKKQLTLEEATAFSQILSQIAQQMTWAWTENPYSIYLNNLQTFMPGNLLSDENILNDAAST